MIERHSGTIELVCDECGEAWPALHEASDLDILLSDTRSAGWRAYRRNGQWMHSCPSCVAEFAAERKGGRLL
jgi:hypothetical protein